MVTDFSSVKKTELNFGKTEMKASFSTVESIMNEHAIYDIINIHGLLYNFQDEETVTKDGKPLRIKKGMLKDETDAIQVVFFGDLIDSIVENRCYDLCKFRVQKFEQVRVLKSTEMSTVKINENINVELCDDEIKVNNSEEEIEAKIVSIDANSFDIRVLCPKCKERITPDNGMVWCLTCGQVSSQEVCDKFLHLKVSTFNIITKMKIDLTVDHAILNHCFNTHIDQEDRKELVKKIMRKTYNITYDSIKGKIIAMSIKN